MKSWSAISLLLAAAACSPTDGTEESPRANSIDAGPAVAEVPSPDMSAIPPVRQAPAATVSRFTTNALKTCRLVEKNEQEAGYYRYRCPGVGGFAYEVVESDLRQSLVIIAPDGTRDNLALSSVAGGGGFSVLGTTYDWRGPTGAPPHSLTVRFNVNENPDPAVPPRPYLIVIRLAAPSCVVGVIPSGSGQNDSARAIADRAPLPPCVASQ